MFRFILATGLIVFTGLLPASPPVPAGSEAIRLDDPAVIQRGEKQFARTCAVCHGHAGSGGRGKPLADRNLDEKRIFNTITNGLRRGASFMPAFEKTLTPAQRRELIAYILTLGK